MKLTLIFLVLTAACLSSCVVRQISPPTLTPSSAWWYGKGTSQGEK